jgi:hypothetical protein
MSEPKMILAERLKRYREHSYDRLVRLIGSQEAEEARAPSGKRYQLEFQVFWDSRPGGDVRVMGSIDDGGIRAIFPVTDDFIKAPDGTFVGE